MLSLSCPGSRDRLWSLRLRQLAGSTWHKQRQAVCGVVHICMYRESCTAIFSPPKIYIKTATGCLIVESRWGIKAVHTQCEPTKIVLVEGRAVLARHLSQRQNVRQSLKSLGELHLNFPRPSRFTSRPSVGGSRLEAVRVKRPIASVRGAVAGRSCEAKELSCGCCT